MKRRIIEIDREKCNGCGACAAACHEGAIAMVDGKAQLMRDDYCDGLGDCLPACPTGAITFVEREAAAYDEQAVLANKQKKMQEQMRKEGTPLPCGCPGSQSRSIRHTETRQAEAVSRRSPVSRLSQWPVQIKLVPVNAPYFDGAKLLIAADCTAYAYAAFHERFIKGHITLVGCPKLDGVDYAEKLTEIIRRQRHPERDHRADGGPLLRRAGARGKDSTAAERKIHSVAGGDYLHRRKNPGLRKHTPIPEAIPAGGVEEGHSSAVNWNLSYSHHIDLAGIPFIP